MTDLFDGNSKRMLHVAPEKALQRKFEKLPNLDYLTGDLNERSAMVKMDITDIQFPNHSFDVIYCSHVLEHVSDDRRAMREFARVLKPVSWAVLLVPVKGDVTFEDPSVTSPEDRESLFGQFDHVRNYGLDFRDRLEEAGFKARIFTTSKIVGGDGFKRLGLPNRPNNVVFYCTLNYDPSPQHHSP